MDWLKESDQLLKVGLNGSGTTSMGIFLLGFFRLTLENA